jgi:hypothetical protein
MAKFEVTLESVRQIIKWIEASDQYTAKQQAEELANAGMLGSGDAKHDPEWEAVDVKIDPKEMTSAFSGR